MPSLDPLLTKAIAVHQAGRVAEAKALYDRILRRRPHDPDALNFLGMLEYQRGNRARGVELLQRSLGTAPANPHAWMNLGNMLLGLGQLEASNEAYERATSLEPGLWQAWFNRGICLRRLQRLEDAVASLRRAINLQPAHDMAYERLGMILYRTGQLQELADLYRNWLEHSPDHPTARHMLAAVTGETPPERASDAYVRHAFDAFAETFDENLADLGYRAPELLADALQRHRPSIGRERGPDVLDAGVGTGLSGPWLKKLARSLVGVDLSPAMVEKARARRLYDELAVGELCEFMRSRRDAFDVVVSADTLVYFGALEEAISAARHCLRPGGLLAFTVELWEGGAAAARFRMGAHGRYLHAPGYVQAVLESSDFSVREAMPVTLRSELGTDVRGLLMVADR